MSCKFVPNISSLKQSYHYYLRNFSKSGPYNGNLIPVASSNNINAKLVRSEKNVGLLVCMNL